MRQQAIQPDVASNAKPFEGRLYVIVLDDLHTQPFHSIAVRRRGQAVHRPLHGRQRPRRRRALERKGQREPGVHGQQAPADCAAVDKFMGQTLQSSDRWSGSTQYQRTRLCLSIRRARR